MSVLATTSIAVSPLPTAWQIADALGCSIGSAVGCEDVDASAAEDVQPRYDALSAEDRALVDSYLSYVEFGERASR